MSRGRSGSGAEVSVILLNIGCNGRHAVISDRSH